MEDLTTIEIATSAMRAVDKALRVKCHVRLDDLPYAEKVTQDNIWVDAKSEDLFVSTMEFTRQVKGNDLKGVAVLYINKDATYGLFQDKGLNESSSDDEIKDACGEFCRVILDGIKQDIKGLGHSDISIQHVKNFNNEVSEKIGINGSCKRFGLIFRKTNKRIFSFDVITQVL